MSLYLMSAAAVSFGIDSKCGSERVDRCLPRPAHQLVGFFFKLLGVSDTEEVKYRNARLSVYRTKFGNVTFIFKRSRYGILTGLPATRTPSSLTIWLLQSFRVFSIVLGLCALIIVSFTEQKILRVFHFFHVFLL